MSNINFLKRLFSEVVIKKQAQLQAEFYHRNFRLFANGIEQNYDSYISSHEQIYKTDIQYSVRYDEETFIENDDKAAMRVFITIENEADGLREIEVVLICKFKDGKIFRIWETTSPDWSKMESFKEYKVDNM